MAKQNLIFVPVIMFTMCFHACFCACPKKWFGPRCEYKCHCASSDDICDPTTGKCPSRCAAGWFGPACQYVDLAHGADIGGVGKPVHIDGNDITCHESAGTLYLSLNKPRSLEWFRIMGDGLDELSLEFSESDAIDHQNLIPCRNMRSSLLGNTLDVYCNMSDPMKTIVVRNANWICSLYVSGGRNVALREYTTQSSDYYHDYSGSDFDRRGYSIFAVDGVTSGYFYDNSCSHTGYGKFEWWKVYFRSPMHIRRYKLYSRTDSSMHRLDNYHMEAYSAKGDRVIEVRGGKPQPVFEEELHRTDVPVASISLTSSLEDNCLTLCEFEAFGDSACRFNRYGLDCELTCNCRYNKPCFVSTGACPSGCAKGWRGDACERMCPDGIYGENCKAACSGFCARNSTTKGICHHVDGSCMYGCKTGYAGLKCTRKCPNGFYGGNCASQCSEFCVSNNSTGRICHHKTGTCLLGCRDGYKGLRCIETRHDEPRQGSDGASMKNETGHVECKK